MPRVKGQPHKIDISGNKYGKWTVLERVAGATWNCICECGAIKAVTGSSLKLGTSTSCGCSQYDVHIKHGMEGTNIYNIWAGMIQRCTNKKYKYFHRYGARGINVCQRWLDFRNFYSDMGDKPAGMSLDRIDNDGNYCKENCKWSTPTEQIRNRSVTEFVDVNGIKTPVAKLAENAGISRKLLSARLKRGINLKDALSLVKSGRWGETRKNIASLKVK